MEHHANAPGDAVAASPGDLSSGPQRAQRLLLFFAFFALSLNMRGPLTSLPPVIGEIREAFGISAGMAGLLTSIPVFCFGIMTPFVGAAMKKFSLETTVAATLSGVLLGTVLRSSGGLSAAVAGTVLIGLALTAGNIATLMLIGRDFARHASAMTGVLVCGMSVGSMATTALTAPAADVAGWRLALALPVIPALGGLLLCSLAARARKRQTGGQVRAVSHGNPTGDSGTAAYRLPVAWLLAAAFACHTFMFYGLTAWLPAYLIQTAGMTTAEAGVSASLFQILGLIGCFGIPLMATRGGVSIRVRFLTVTVAWMVTTAGYFFFPRLSILWNIFGGLASGGGFTVIFGLIMTYAKTLDENRRISSMVQTAGYMVASLSPFVIGYIRGVTGGWEIGMGLLICAGAAMTLSGLAACRA